ncbi:SusC/RagA family TonB-linked outer membrane protein [Pontibacter amylolyticus]|uniref:SusC/RagA family TonB-linked outer membrane protein n=1 Tax=Pontibacter amylolyticus TaxID=1424080 RepID=A0ABQ1W0J7_9BACT|nr:TonB-dependent receptor [Pontibacter amylolyticus]GGG07113.1 SusC/RagA family TonB-linked outer membrane protein [Pontibacter amylolyticus]
MKKVLLLNFLFLFALLGQVAAQSRTITGKVTGAGDGVPLPGVSVVVKGTTTGTATNADGSFSVNVPENANTLVFRYIGYVAQEVAIGANTSINVALEMDSKQLSEVVIQVPYGTIAKTAFTGAESTITTKAIERQQVTSVTRVLEGLVPGIQTTNGGGAPGSNASVRVRGIGSIYSSSEPLYVVDGVPFSGTLQSISTDDIASVTVLKDAAASSLYGSRAANGVIMITTKRGKTGKPSIAVNLRRGVSDRAIKEYDRVNEQEYYELMWEAMRNAKLGGAPQPGQDLTAANQFASDNIAGGNGLVYNPFNVPGNQVIDPATGRLNPNARLLYSDSWAEELFQQSNRTDLSMNVSGGAEKSDYYLSVGYIKEDGIAKFSGYDRVNARASINTQITDWLKSGINIAGNMSENQGNYATGTATSNPFYYSRYMGPIYPVWQRDGEGNFVTDPIRGGNALDWGNASQMGARPYAPNSNLLGTLALDERSLRRSEATVNTFAEVKFLEDFTFKTTFGGNYYNGFGTTYQNSQFGDAANVSGRSTKSDRRTLSYTFNQVLTWNKQFGNHSLRALAGHENYDWESRNVSATKTGFAFPGTTELASAATLTDGTSDFEDHKIESYFTQLNYSLSDKYLASASFRRDGSSRFHKDTRWGNFFSIGAGWRISEEDFFNAEWVDELKLRGSYGEQGNENTLNLDGSQNYYAWQGLYSLGWNNVNAPGALVTSLPAMDLQWESNANFNIGADFKFFNKVEGTVEYFERISNNLLFLIPLPYSTGGLGKWENIGTMKNNGWELQLGYNAVSTNDFDWRMDLNLTSYTNKITKLPDGNPIIEGTKRYAEGQNIYDFWLREYYGVDPSNGDALYRTDHTLYKANNPAYQIIGQDTVTNAINNATYAYQGSAIPDLMGGFTNSFRYKGFDLAVLMTFQVGGKFYDSNYGSLMHRGTYGTHFSKDMLNRWTPENTNTDVPRLQQGLATQDGASSRWLFDASYLNIKNINLGYTLPNTLTSKVGVNSMRAFVSVDNAKIFTKNEGMDPQRSFTGTSDFTYPVMRTFTLGLNANF